MQGPWAVSSAVGCIFDQSGVRPEPGILGTGL